MLQPTRCGLYFDTTAKLPPTPTQLEVPQRGCLLVHASCTLAPRLLGVGFYRQTTIHDLSAFYFQINMEVSHGTVDFHNVWKNTSQIWHWQLARTNEKKWKSTMTLSTSIFSKIKWWVYNGIVDESLQWEVRLIPCL